tara:strand:- start:2151 stop:3242 length:1092 start_codon:yes stop_codon:yes gene_type:complete
MRKLDLYLIKNFSSIFIVTLIGFVSIFVIVDLIENLDKFIDSSVSGSIVLKYYLLTLPWFINIGLPMSVLLGGIFTIGLLSKRNELTAMKATGFSLYRIALPLIICSILISAGSFFIEDSVASRCNKELRTIEKTHLGKKRKKHYKQKRHNILLRTSDQFHIAINYYRVDKKSARGIAMQFLNDGHLYKRIDAAKMNWIAEDSVWRINNYAVREFDADGFESNVRYSKKDTMITLTISPDDITKEAISPEEKNYKDLKAFIVELRKSGVDTTRWEVNLHGKISFAFTSLIVMLFAVPLVAAKPKGGLAFGAGMSVFVIFGYYAFIRFGQTIGYKSIVDPFLSAWIGNVVFLIGGIMMLIFVRK